MVAFFIISTNFLFSSESKIRISPRGRVDDLEWAADTTDINSTMFRSRDDNNGTSLNETNKVTVSIERPSTPLSGNLSLPFLMGTGRIDKAST